MSDLFAPLTTCKRSQDNPRQSKHFPDRHKTNNTEVSISLRAVAREAVALTVDKMAKVRGLHTVLFVAKMQATSQGIANITGWPENSKKKMMLQEAAKHQNTSFITLTTKARPVSYSTTHTCRQTATLFSTLAIRKDMSSPRMSGSSQHT
jgi:hypothetical protein